MAAVDEAGTLRLSSDPPPLTSAQDPDRTRLDKSTVSRQLNQLFDAGLLDRKGGRPGRRGDPLSLTPAGRRALTDDAKRIRTQLTRWLEDWDDGDVALLASLMARFNASVDKMMVS